VCIGSSIVDYTVFVTDEWLKSSDVEKGGLIQVSSTQFNETLCSFKYSPIVKTGGSAGIAVKGLGHLGSDVAFLSRYGDDEEGRFFRSTLLENKVQLYGPILHGETPRVLCLITPDGQRSFFFCSGDHGTPSAHDLTEEPFQDAHIVHCEGYTLRNKPLLEKIIQIAQKHNVKISFDLGSFIPVRDNREYIKQTIIPSLDILIGNEDEMTALFGSDSERDYSLKNLPCLSVVLKGKEGCFITYNKEMFHFDTKPVLPIDTTGAGDMFTSGLLFGLTQGWPLEKCAALANRLGSTVVENIGGEIPEEQWLDIKKEYSL
jgi:sugar/nucleoside kinase (ribokinase family)